MATDGYNLLVLPKENIPNAQSPPPKQTHHPLKPNKLTQTPSANNASDASRSPMSPVSNSSPLRHSKAVGIKTIDAILVRNKALDDENAVLNRKVEVLENENKYLRTEMENKENDQLQHMRKECNQLRKNNFELTQKIRRLDEYLILSKTLTSNLQKDKLQLLQLVKKHHDLAENLQIARDILGDKNVKICDELNDQKIKIEEAEKKSRRSQKSGGCGGRRIIYQHGPHLQTCKNERT